MKDYSFTGYDPKIGEVAKKLRKNMTPQERKLWYCFLRDYPVKFYRQRVIERFVADFYCSSAKLVIELDGSQHYTEQGMIYDEERSAMMLKYQLKVLRFRNIDVDRYFQTVCEQIHNEVVQRSKIRKHTLDFTSGE